MKLIFLAFLIIPAALQANPFPPVGQRSYQIDSDVQIKKVQIKPSASDNLGRTFMRDPILVGTPAQEVDEEEALNKLHEIERKGSKISFEKVGVGGRYLVPRVSFDSREKPLKRKIVKKELNHRMKVQQSEEILRDLEW